jgi:hypothetical protein
MRDGAADGAEVPHERVGDPRGRRAEHAVAAAHELGALALLVAHERTQTEVALLLHEALELLDAVDVNEQAGRREPELQQRDQALPAREHLRVVAVLGEHGHGLPHGLRRDVLEPGRIHGAASLRSTERAYDCP